MISAQHHAQAARASAPRASTPYPTSLDSAGAALLQKTLDGLVDRLPCAHLSVASPHGVLFQGQAGVFDVLDRDGVGSRGASEADVLWFASTTKLLTAVCYLQLVDRGVLTLDTDLRPLHAQLGEATSRIIERFEHDGRPVLIPNHEPIPLSQMLNQTSGFGMEFGDKVPLWKKVADKGRGFVNSCKAENLIHTPLCARPGQVFQYGNSAEWLALMLPSFAGVSTEEYLQQNVLRPLKMGGTTYYPFDTDLAEHLVPLRYGKDAEQGGDIHWEILDGQLDLLTLPRRRQDIEYPAGGGGIYSKTSDYVVLLQHLLSHYLSLTDPSVSRPAKPLLSDTSVTSLFHPTLSGPARSSFTAFYSRYLGLEGSNMLQEGEADWSTAMAIYQPGDGRRRSGWGRRAGSVGWGGAAGTEYWMDPHMGIAVVFTTQMLPGRCPAVTNAKEAIEKAVYKALEGGRGTQD